MGSLVLRWTNADAFKVTPIETPVSFSAAIATVNAAHPGFQAGGVNVYHGLYEISSADADSHPGFYGVDPGTGRITGHVDDERGFMAFLNQVHECFFTCDDQPGYISVLNKQVVTLGMGWLDDVTYGDLILGLAGLMLLFLALSGIWLWWPTFKKWKHGFRVRWNKGLDTALASARTVAGPGTTLDYASLPDTSDATSTYSFWFGKGFDQYGHGAYPGNYNVQVDRHNAGNTHIGDYAGAPTLSNRLLDNWGAPMFHYGQSVNAWWRLIWFGFGLTPLLLAITGVSTWLARRTVRKRRKQYVAVAT
jgi:uncharacterized iron-regulated membrane protein